MTLRECGIEAEKLNGVAILRNSGTTYCSKNSDDIETVNLSKGQIKQCPIKDI